MGNILIIESDPVFGAVAADRLHVAGHEVELLTTIEEIQDRDLLILEVSGAGDLDVLAEIRDEERTDPLPVLVLSRSVESTERVAALKAGADDYLTKPCDLEELVLRSERLIDSRGAQMPMLQGDLASHPLWELVQYVQAAKKDGTLALRAPGVNARLGFRGGQVRTAELAELPPDEALLAVLGMKRGRFRFITGEVPKGDDGLNLNEVLMQAAWLEDELEKRRDHLPATGVPLRRAIGTEIPRVEEGSMADGLPLEQVAQQIEQGRVGRIFELLDQLEMAPQKVRLAVAWLVEAGVLGLPDDSSLGTYPTTSEINSVRLIELSIAELLGMARRAGFGTTALPFLIAVEEAAWPDLLRLFEGVPGYFHNQDLQNLVESLREHRRGQHSFVTEAGKLALHVELLDAVRKVPIEAVATVSAGTLLWLADGSSDRELLGTVIARLEAISAEARGILVANRKTGELANELVQGTRRWQLTPHAPHSLFGVLRLLQPQPPG